MTRKDAEERRLAGGLYFTGQAVTRKDCQPWEGVSVGAFTPALTREDLKQLKL